MLRTETLESPSFDPREQDRLAKAHIRNVSEELTSGKLQQGENVMSRLTDGFAINAIRNALEDMAINGEVAYTVVPVGQIHNVELIPPAEA